MTQCCGVGVCADGIIDYGGCKGGDPWGAWHYFNQYGLMSEKCVPYPSHNINNNHQSCPQSCKNQDQINNNQNIVIELSKKFYGNGLFYRLPNDESTIRKEIMDHGSVVAALVATYDLINYNKRLNVNETFFYQCNNYSYSLDYNNFYDNQTKRDESLNILPPIPTHAVRLIGWGISEATETISENKKRKSVPYWLAANSYGNGWGDGGLFKIVRGNNSCRIEEFVTAGFPKI